MYYSIEGVFYEYEWAERLFAEGKFAEAAEHYGLMNAHYENADDIEKLSGPDCPVTMLMDGVERSFPSVNECLRRASDRMKTIRRKAKNKKK